MNYKDPNFEDRKTWSKKRLILLHLTTKRSITPVEALREYGCLRLGARIFELRREGWDIETKIIKGRSRWGEPEKMAQYVLKNVVSENGDVICSGCGFSMFSSDHASKCWNNGQKVSEMWDDYFKPSKQ